MTPAQKALQEKLARVRAAKNESPKTKETSKESKEVESIQERKVQEVSNTSGESGNSGIPKKESTAVQSSTPASPEIPACNSERSTVQFSQTEHPLKMQLAELEAALNEKQPGFKTILQDIHAKLRNDPAIVTLLSEDEIGGIVEVLKQHAQVEIIAPKAAKTKKAATKALLANMSADDL